MTQVKTSESHPIRVDWAVGTTGHRVGVTFAPGKHQADAHTGAWARNLAVDLDRLVREYRISVLGSLIEDHELRSLKIPNLVAEANARHIAVHRHPISDGGLPTDLDAFHDFVEGLAGEIVGGHILAVHCKGGLGRAGTVAACVLIQLGTAPRAALAAIKAARGPHSPDTGAQERFILGWQPRPKPIHTPPLGLVQPFGEVWTEAWRAAAVAHHGDKAWKLPGAVKPAYIAHVGNVMLELLAAHAVSPIPDLPLAVPVAALHDCIEDTGFGYDAIAGQFGKAIADGVLAVSKSKQIADTQGAGAAMADSLERIRLQPP